VAAESKKLRRRPWLIPMSYSGGLGWFGSGSGGGKRRGEHGYFIGEATATNRARSEGGREDLVGVISAQSPAEFSHQRRRSCRCWQGGPLLARWGGLCTISDFSRGGPQAESRAGPDWFPRPFNIFFLFSFFSFLFSLFIHNFCIWYSNDFKPIANFL
jgi:hypothetical protein